MKIRTRLSLWYVCVTMIILLAFCLGTYAGMRHLLFRALENERELIARSIESNYDPVAKRFTKLQTMPSQANPYSRQDYLIIYDATQEPVYRSRMADEMKLTIPLAREQRVISTVITERTSATRASESLQRTEVRFQAVSRQLFYKQQHIGWVNFASSIADIESSMQKLLKTLLGGILIAGVLIGSGAYFLTRQTLRPVAAITQKARKISSSNLTERIEVSNPQDELGQLAVVLNDLLERLQSAFDSQRRFLADAAHELKTPLAILRTQWEDELNNTELSRRFKEKIVGDVETITRLSRLINNMLLLSHTESAESRFQFGSVPLESLLQEVCSDAEVLAEMKSQDLRIGPLDAVTIEGDKDRLYQLLFNLLDNAVRYTPENGTISLSIRAESGFALVGIRDNGPGIASEHLPHIFDRFYRVNKDRSRKTGGTGLGLSICKLIAQSHGGDLIVDSEVGAGTVFTVRLPISAQSTTL